jgi:Type I phosphodiesterase / nucleotide pyrophosphatase
MAQQGSVLLLEFNELCPSLIERFMREQQLPNFKRLYEQSLVYTTDAQEEQEYLEPWVQWVTVHTGVGYAEHRVFNLGDADRLTCESVWDILARAGLSVGLCGSMNIKYAPDLNGFVLPDAWSSGIKPKPDELEPFFRFVQVSVQEHTNTSVPLTKTDYVKLLWFLGTHGLSFSSVAHIIKQLTLEKLGKVGRWKRAVILDALQWDVFQWYFRKYRPRFSTFFVNSTAHFQHKYWRNMDPEKFTLRPSAEEQKQYAEAVLFGYQAMDKLIGKAFALAGSVTTILLASALSQQPYLKMEESGGKRFYRPYDFDKFTNFVGLEGVSKVAPVMSEQFHIYFENEQAAQRGSELLSKVRVDGRHALHIRQDSHDVFTGCHIFDRLPRQARIDVAGTERSQPFFELFYEADCLKSGMHHPDGILWIQTPERAHRMIPGHVPLRSVAPTILRLFDVPVPSHMLAAPLPTSLHEEMSPIAV